MPDLPDEALTFDYAEEERERLAAAAVLRGAEFAGFPVRLIASLIDIALLWLTEVGLVFALWTLGLLPITEKELGEGLGLFLAVVFWAFPAWPYFAALESSRRQATLGKQLFGLRVTDVAGRRIGFGRASARHWVKVHLCLPPYVWFLTIVFTARKQGLHDIAAGTLVLKESR